MATGEEAAGAPDHARDVAFGPDGQTLAVARDTDVMLWDVPTGKARVAYPVRTKWVNRVLFSPDGQNLAAVYVEDLGAKGLLANVRLWDVSTGKERATIRSSDGGGTGIVRCAAFSPDGKTLATGDCAGAVKLWDVAAGMKNTATFYGQTDEIPALAFSSDGETLASVDDDDEIKLWDVASGRNTATFNTSDPWLKFSRRPRLFRLVGDIFDAHPGITSALPGTGSQPKDVPLSLSFTPTRALMALGSDGRDETTVKVWRVTTAPVRRK